MLLLTGCGSAAATVDVPIVAAAPSAEPAAPAASLTPATGTPTITVTTIATSAAATSPATRVDPPPTDDCTRVAAAITAHHGDGSQLVEVRTTGWTDTTAVVQVARRTDTGWTCGPAMVARLGRAGVRPLLQRRSGDDTTPAGVFPLGTMTAPDGQVFSFFGNQPDPGVTAGGYRLSQPGDCFGATPNTARYGHLITSSTCVSPDERIATTGAYTTVALIGANTEPDVSGDAPGETPYAAAIFLHRFTYATPGATSGATKATSGCVSLAQTDLTAVLVGMPRDVRFAIGPTDWLVADA